MAAAGTLPTPTKHPRAREERERPRKSAAEHLQQASAKIDKARQEATADVRRSLDTALEPMRPDASARSARPRRSRDSRTRSASRRQSWGRRRPKGDGAKS